MDETISIRPYRPEDVDPIYAAVVESRAELTQWMPWCHAGYFRDDTAAWVNSRPAAWDAKTEYSFVIVDGDARILGACGLNRIEAINGTANLGYWVRTSAARRGVATQSVLRLKEWAFANTPFHRLDILVAAENLPSRRVAEKSGATQEGLLRSRLLLHGRRHDAVLYSLVAE